MRIRPLFYVLTDDGTKRAIPFGDLTTHNAAEFARRLHDHHRVGWTDLEGIIISTVFMGIDHNFGGLHPGPPILFETMIFNHGANEFQRRYCTWAEAELGHIEAVELIQAQLEQLKSLSQDQAREEIQRIMAKAEK